MESPGIGGNWVAFVAEQARRESVIATASGVDQPDAGQGCEHCRTHQKHDRVPCRYRPGRAHGDQCRHEDSQTTPESGPPTASARGRAIRIPVSAEGTALRAARHDRRGPLSRAVWRWPWRRRRLCTVGSVVGTFFPARPTVRLANKLAVGLPQLQFPPQARGYVVN